MENKKLKITIINIHQGAINRGVEAFIDELSTQLGGRHDITIVAGNKSLPLRWPVLWRFFIDQQSLLILLFTLRQIPKIWKDKPDIIVPLNGGWQTLLVRIIYLNFLSRNRFKTDSNWQRPSL